MRKKKRRKVEHKNRKKSDKTVFIRNNFIKLSRLK